MPDFLFLSHFLAFIGFNVIWLLGFLVDMNIIIGISTTFLNKNFILSIGGLIQRKNNCNKRPSIRQRAIALRACRDKEAQIPGKERAGNKELVSI